MKPKFVALIGLIAIAATLGAWKVTSATKQRQLAELDAAPDKGSLNWKIRKAKAEGKREIMLPPPIVDFNCAGCDTVEVLLHSAVVVAKPIAKKSVVVDSTVIQTWYKFLVTENLSGNPIPSCNGCATPVEKLIPEKLRPENPGEFVLIAYGGTVVIDGIRVTTTDAEYPEFSLSESYLLPITMFPGGIAAPVGGPGVILSIGDDGTLRPFSLVSHPFKRDLETYYDNSLDRVREMLRSKQRIQ